MQSLQLFGPVFLGGSCYQGMLRVCKDAKDMTTNSNLNSSFGQPDNSISGQANETECAIPDSRKPACLFWCLGRSVGMFAPLVTCAQGETIIEQGEEGHDFFILYSGELAVIKDGVNPSSHTEHAKCAQDGSKC
eukprot:3237108-Amphidinium_carterae.1